MEEKKRGRREKEKGVVEGKPVGGGGKREESSWIG